MNNALWVDVVQTFDDLTEKSPDVVLVLDALVDNLNVDVRARAGQIDSNLTLRSVLVVQYSIWMYKILASFLPLEPICGVLVASMALLGSIMLVSSSTAQPVSTASQ